MAFCGGNEKIVALERVNYPVIHYYLSFGNFYWMLELRFCTDIFSIFVEILQMNALPISLEARPFQGLLNGLIKKNFMGASDITNDYLLQELYADMEESVEGQFASEISLYEKVR